MAKSKPKKGALKPHSKGKVKKLEKLGARSRVVKGSLAKALLEQAPAAVDAVRGSVVATITQARPTEKIPKGLVEIAVNGSAYKLLGMQNQAATPTLEQRVAIARRLNEVGPKLPKYVKNVIQEKPLHAPVAAEATEGVTTQIGVPDMGKKTTVGGLNVKEIEKAFEQNRKEVEQREKEKKVQEAADKKAAEKKAKQESEARKKMKCKDVSPRTEHLSQAKREQLEKPVKGKSQDPGAKVKGISSPPVRKAAGMTPAPVPKGGFTKDNRPATSGELIRSRIMEQKLTDDAIAAEVRKLWPGRTTAVSDVRWNRSQMQKAGVKNVPDPVEGSTVPAGRKGK